MLQLGALSQDPGLGNGTTYDYYESSHINQCNQDNSPTSMLRGPISLAILDSRQADR